MPMFAETDLASRRDCPADPRGCQLLCYVDEPCHLLVDEGDLADCAA